MLGSAPVCGHRRFRPCRQFAGVRDPRRLQRQKPTVGHDIPAILRPKCCQDGRGAYPFLRAEDPAQSARNPTEVLIQGRIPASSTIGQGSLSVGHAAFRPWRPRAAPPLTARETSDQCASTITGKWTGKWRRIRRTVRSSSESLQKTASGSASCKRIWTPSVAQNHSKHQTQDRGVSKEKNRQAVAYSCVGSRGRNPARFEIAGADTRLSILLRHCSNFRLSTFDSLKLGLTSPTRALAYATRTSGHWQGS